MATGIEFTSTPGKTFVATLKNPLSGYATLDTGIAVTTVSAGRYRLVTARTGIVWMDALDGATRVVGFADLDRPAANGYSDVVDEMSSVQGACEAAIVSLDVDRATSFRPKAI